MAQQSSSVALEREGRLSSTVLQTDSTVQTWLEVLGLLEYVNLFKQYRTLEEIIHLSETELRDLGVRNGAHRARMISNLIMIRESNLRRNRTRIQEIGIYDRNSNEATIVSKSRATIFPSSSLQEAVHPLEYIQPSNHEFSEPEDICHNLMAYPWYHASISRQDAENLASNDGWFLVRDSSTMLGDFVLTTSWKGMPRHFMINKITVPGMSKIMYHFEEEPFENVPSLIEYYVYNHKPVTSSSGAVISVPVARNESLSLASNKTLNYVEMMQSGDDLKENSMKHKRTGSEPLLSFDGDRPNENERVTYLDKRHGSLPLVRKNALSIVRITESTSQDTMFDQKSLDSQLSVLPLSAETPDENKTEVSLNLVKEQIKESGPPKPSRVPTIKKRMAERPLVVKRNQALYEDDGKDYSDYDQVRSSPGSKISGNKQLNNRNLDSKSSSSSLPLQEATMDPHDVNWLSGIIYGGANGLKSYFDNLIEYKNSLLAADNKPLDSSAYASMKSLVLYSDTVVLARHLTAVDLDLLKITGSHNFGFGVTSGLELITLPQGHYLREDIVERHYSLKLFVSVTILLCTSCAERASLMHQWIQVAHELRSCFGNLFGFSAIMEGLLADQVLRLEKSWMTLDQQNGTSGFLFMHRLRPFLKSLNDATSILPLHNIAVPHILPLSELLLNDFVIGNGAVFLQKAGIQRFELDSLLAYLDTARIIAEQCGIYRKAAQKLLSEAELEEPLLELLSPRTHMKFLWGSKGIRAAKMERISKFEEILNVLSHKVEPGKG